jgi:hypothetical protein
MRKDYAHIIVLFRFLAVFQGRKKGRRTVARRVMSAPSMIRNRETLFIYYDQPEWL